MIPASGELFRQTLREQINPTHPLVRLADVIDWDRIKAVCVTRFASRLGCPTTAPRLIAGLLYLQHAFGLTDEDMVWGWVENSYWQVFTGETYLQIEVSLDPSSLTRWRQRLGEEGIEELLAATIAASQRSGAVCKSSLNTVFADTTVMLKAVAHPTDSRLLERSREHLVKAARENGLKLRQNYDRESPRQAQPVLGPMSGWHAPNGSWHSGPKTSISCMPYMRWKWSASRKARRARLTSSRSRSQSPRR